MVISAIVVALTKSELVTSKIICYSEGSYSPFFMEKDKLKLIVRNLRLLVDALESEVYSDTESYTKSETDFLPPLPDYDEVFEDDE